MTVKVGAGRAARGGMHRDRTVLTVRNKHPGAGSPASTTRLKPVTTSPISRTSTASSGSSFRHHDAERGTVYGSDIGWHGIEVYERSPEQLRQELLANGARPDTLDRVQELVDPLVPNVILNDSERTWLNNVWHTSDVVPPGHRETALVALAHRLAAQRATPETAKHPNTAEYRTAIQKLTLTVGREAGQRTLDDDATITLLREALKALKLK